MLNMRAKFHETRTFFRNLNERKVRKNEVMNKLSNQQTRPITIPPDGGDKDEVLFTVR